MAYQHLQVSTKQRVATRENERSRIQCYDLVETPERFIRAKFQWMGMRLCLGPAMDAGQVAGTSNFINDNERAIIQLLPCPLVRDLRNLLHRLQFSFYVTP